MTHEREEWRRIPGFSFDYEVSNLGRVRRVAGRIVRSNGRPQTFRERVLSPVVDEWGYLMVGVDGKTIKIHRLVALAFLGPRPFPGAVIRHLDGNPKNNRADNLLYGSSYENVMDCYDYRGSLSKKQKLTEKKVAEIKKLLLSGRKSRSIAEDYGVSEQTICDIKHERIYRRVQP